jgi:hypothetical protein
MVTRATGDQFIPLTVGERLSLRLLRRGILDDPVNCMVVAVDPDLVWFVIPTLSAKPLRGTQVQLALDDGHIEQSAMATVEDFKRSRRGFAFAIRPPEAWNVVVYDESVRAPTSLPADVLLLASGEGKGIKTLPSQVSALSTTSARLNGRIRLRLGTRLGVRFTTADSRFIVMGEVIRVIGEHDNPTSGLEVDVRFDTVSEEALAWINGVVEKAQADNKVLRAKEAEESEKEWMELQSEIRKPAA